MALTDKLSAIADAIRAKTGKTDTMTLDQMPTEIASITGGGGEGEKPFDCHSVTFVYGDKSYVRSVADGDTCADPVERGLIPTPTKESTAQYNYTFYGWGASDGGAADANILKNIRADKTVYAIFTATVRYYTITYYDSDGTTALKTERLAYGATPTYTGVKEGYMFEGWIPEVTKVTGDASYTGQFSEGYSFAKSSWADIAAISEAGEAQKYFSLGDTRQENMGSTLGTVTLMIIGFDHDDLADGSGKAGMTIGMVNTSPNKITFDEDMSLPSAIYAVSKWISYPTYYNGESTVTSKELMSFCWSELGITSNTMAGAGFASTYAAVTRGLFSAKASSPSSSSYIDYWARGYKPVSSSSSKYRFTITSEGKSHYTGDPSKKLWFRGHFSV